MAAEIVDLKPESKLLSEIKAGHLYKVLSVTKAQKVPRGFGKGAILYVMFPQNEHVLLSLCSGNSMMVEKAKEYGLVLSLVEHEVVARFTNNKPPNCRPAPLG